MCKFTKNLHPLTWILLTYIIDKNKLKIWALFYLWFNISRLLFDKFFIQYFKTTIYLIWFNVLRFLLSPTHEKLFAFPSTIFTFTFLYTHVYSPSWHSISNTIRGKKKKKDVNYLQPFNDTYITQHCGTI